MENEHNKKVMETIGFAILFPIISIGCSFGVSYLEAKLGLLSTFLILLAVLLLSLVSVYFGGKAMAYIGRGSIDESVDASIKNILDRLSNNIIMNGICREEQLALIERTCTFSEIWLISSDLLTEINNGIYAGVVQKNLRRGTKYRYFVPHTPINELRVKMFRESCNKNKNLEIYYLSDDFFFLVPDIDFAIYEPLKSITDGKQGYMGLQIQGLNERYAVLMNNDFVDALASKLEECKKKSISGGLK